MSDDLVSSRFSPSSIRSQFQRGQPPAAPPDGAGSDATSAGVALADKSDPLPRPGDAYRVHGRHGNKPELTLHFVLKDYSYEGFSYGDFERVRLVPGDKPGGGPVLILRFSGSVITEVTIEGRHLHPLYHWIGLHRMPWVWEHPSPSHFAEDDAAVISGIRFDTVER